MSTSAGTPEAAIKVRKESRLSASGEPQETHIKTYIDESILKRLTRQAAHEKRTRLTA